MTKVEHPKRPSLLGNPRRAIEKETPSIPSGYLTVCHGKSPFLIGKPSISMGHTMANC